MAAFSKPWRLGRARPPRAGRSCGVRRPRFALGGRRGAGRTPARAGQVAAPRGRAGGAVRGAERARAPASSPHGDPHGLGAAGPPRWGSLGRPRPSEQGGGQTLSPSKAQSRESLGRSRPRAGRRLETGCDRSSAVPPLPHPSLGQLGLGAGGRGREEACRQASGAWSSRTRATRHETAAGWLPPVSLDDLQMRRGI